MPLDSRPNHMRCYLDTYFTLMIFFMIRKMLPKHGTSLPWLNSILLCLPEAEKNRPMAIFSNDEFKNIFTNNRTL